MDKYWLIFLVGVAMGSIVFAEEPEQTATPNTAQTTAQDATVNSDTGERRGRSGRNSEAMKEMREAYQKADEQLKEKFPAEFAEIEKLSQTDRRAAFEQKRALATKAGIEMPTFSRSRTSRNSEQKPSEPETAKDDKLAEWQKIETLLKEKYPIEFAEYEKLRQTDRSAALIKLKELADKEKLTLPAAEIPENKILPRDLARLVLERAESIVQRRYPEEHQELEKLRETDPDAARDKFRELVKKAGLSYEELKRQVYVRPPSTRVIQVETPAQAPNPTQNYGNVGRTSWTRPQ
ncbi:MAG: hypothetical protein PHS31_03720 [Victivallaceae bacterium]|nr:hypothetical protein [Victivallaceae bacterium]MDD4180068.1 hypothetical protein [Victivallaceae bacterium]